MEVLDLPLCASAQGFKALCKGSGNFLKEPTFGKLHILAWFKAMRGARCVADVSLLEAEAMCVLRMIKCPSSSVRNAARVDFKAYEDVSLM
ncbi:hypothetical protein L3X38_013526 [Prunus dulcis]|uniref:Uncharacterized protein n=1 Tax=Prunus dulcis TaxID=3755 RepID=A0AAD4WN32_PRUDU|nr:hypothetical protein L3X38_013526 [Prunus dulcis]